MSIRYAPFATVKVLSVATRYWRQIQSGVEDGTAFGNAVQEMLNIMHTANETNLVSAYDNQFDHIGLADSITINEDYGTNPIYGIGEPTNPTFVPGNMSVRVNITRLTTDAKSIADYVLKPSYYYDEKMQRRAINNALANTIQPDQGVQRSRNADRLFHVYFSISDIEHNSRLRDFDNFELINNYQIIEFMPVSYGKRINSDNALIFTDVDGIGKVKNLRNLTSELTSNIPQTVT